MRFEPRLLVFALILCAAVIGGCRERANEAEFDGTLGDAMIEFISAVEGLATDLSVISDVAGCRAAEGSIARRVRLLQRLSPIVAGVDAETWRGMPQSVIERRDAALRFFNREAVRVLLDRERSRVLGPVVGEVPSLIYLDFQQDS